ncbi:bone morphogenetic protein 5-like [Anneissia japonica]|uniref:bone morphogenetic protein 5-like n=1 Tax=Anneissia japonica TaxID=1529436 RepID=UPI001425A8DD|nr:bone morphogenetic protein 5-like [Anneissia japonica]
MANSKITWIVTIFIISAAILEAEVKTIKGERELVLEAFKRHILQELGMDSPPSAPATAMGIIDETINLTFYNEMRKLLDKEYNPTQASVVEEHIELHPSYTKTLTEDEASKSYRIVFSVPSYHKKRMRTVDIESATATLHLYAIGKNDTDCVLTEEPPPQSNNSDENDTKDTDRNWTSDFDNPDRPQIQQKIGNDTENLKITIYELNATNHRQHKIHTDWYHLERTGWVTINLNLTDIAKRIRFQVKVESSEDRISTNAMRIITNHCNESELYHPLYRMFKTDVINTQPRLEIKYFRTIRHQSRDRNRIRRQASQSCDNFSQPHPCCMKTSIVTFKELGMADLIIAPTSFTASFCTGTCSQLLVQSEAQGGHNYQEQCCGPVEANDLPVLLSIKGRIHYRRLSNLVVTYCGCT